MERASRTASAASVDIESPVVHYETAIEQAMRTVREIELCIARERRRLAPYVRRAHDKGTPKASVSQLQKTLDSLVDFLAEEERRAVLDCARTGQSAPIELTLLNAATDGRPDTRRSTPSLPGALRAAQASRAQWRGADARAAQDDYANDATFAARHVDVFDRLIGWIESALAEIRDVADHASVVIDRRAPETSLHAHAAAPAAVAADCQVGQEP